MKILLSREFVFRPEDSKTNLCIDLPTTCDYDRLEFTCSYSPKYVDDMEVARQAIESQIGKYMPAKLLPQYGNWEDYLPLMNFVTFSLDFNGKYIGCAHRHAPEQHHIISENFSSPGFFKQKAQAGAWRVVLNIHAVITSEVLYKLTITAKEQGED